VICEGREDVDGETHFDTAINGCHDQFGSLFTVTHQ